MTGKILSLAILVCALIAGAGMYYLQVYAYYYEVPEDQAEVVLTTTSGAAEVLDVLDFQGIDAESSPIRYRACFSTTLEFDTLLERFEAHTGSDPRNAPGWFDCFDAAAIGGMIEAGDAVVLTGQRNLEFGIDRVVAITRDGRGYVWHDVNDCGDKLYDGSPKGTDCPEPGAAGQEG